MLYSVTLTFIFKVKTQIITELLLQIWCTLWPWSHFSRANVKCLKVKLWESVQNAWRWRIIEVSILHRIIVPLRILYSETLTFHFQGHNANDHKTVLVDLPPLLQQSPTSCSCFYSVNIYMAPNFYCPCQVILWSRQQVGGTLFSTPRYSAAKSRWRSKVSKVKPVSVLHTHQNWPDAFGKVAVNESSTRLLTPHMPM